MKKLAFRWDMFLWSAALFPVATLLHEVGHFAAAAAVGFSPKLHFASVTGFPETPPFGGAPLGVAFASFAGPAVTMILGFIGAARTKSSWGLPLVAVCVPRFIVNSIFLLQQSLVLAGIAQASNPNFDEIVTARALAITPAPLAAIGAILFFAGLAWLWLKSSRGGLLALFVGTGVGMFGWLAYLGPAVLP